MKYLFKILSLSRLFGTGFVIFIMTAELPAQTSVLIVFVSRNLVHNGNLYYPSSGMLPGMGPLSRFKMVGGSLLVREAIGNIRVLVDSTMSFNGISLIDVSDPDVFPDASKIVFSGIEYRDSSWRIYEINSDGRICFASTRYPSLSEYYGFRTTNLYVINSDGTSLHRITTERNGAEKPSVDPGTGSCRSCRN